jgi:hypothetical protein
MALPKLDREAYENQIRVEFENVLRDVADAVDNAPRGRIIRDSEEKARDALDRFRRAAYEKAVQMKVNAAEAAFSPSAQRDDREKETKQGETTSGLSNLFLLIGVLQIYMSMPNLLTEVLIFQRMLPTRNKDLRPFAKLQLVIVRSLLLALFATKCE